MIEVDLQLVIRMHLRGRMNERVESDKRVSKHNYGSRKGHYMENALSQKTLVFDHAKKMEELNVCTMSDLEACYDIHITESCGLVEESIESNRKVIHLLTKLLPRLEHHVGAFNGISADEHGSKNNLLGGIGQGDIFSGVVCRDVSCIIFRKLDRKKIGIIIKSKCEGNIEQRVVIEQADDACF